MDRRVRGFGYVRICSIYKYLFVDLLLVYYSYLGRFMPTPSALAKSTSFTVFAQPIPSPFKPSTLPANQCKSLGEFVGARDTPCISLREVK